MALGIPRRIQPSKNYSAWRGGVKKPSRAQLNKMSKAYYQPLLVFYLGKPPRKGDRGEDFPYTAEQQSSDPKGKRPILDLLMRDVSKQLRSLISDVLEEERAESLPFVGSAKHVYGRAGRSQKSIVETLRFDLTVFRSKRTTRDAFSYLRERIERNGIFVLLLSDLGSHHTTIPVEVFRAFAYIDDLAPFIVINRKDAVSAWCFTALHEVVPIYGWEQAVFPGNLG